PPFHRSTVPPFHRSTADIAPRRRNCLRRRVRFVAGPIQKMRAARDRAARHMPRVASKLGRVGQGGAMLHPLVSTPPNELRRPGVLLLSITVHALLVYAAFTPHLVTGGASGDVARPVERPPLVERIRYLTIAPVVNAPAAEEPAAKAAVPAPPEAMQ